MWQLKAYLELSTLHSITARNCFLTFTSGAPLWPVTSWAGGLGVIIGFEKMGTKSRTPIIPAGVMWLLISLVRKTGKLLCGYGLWGRKMWWCKWALCWRPGGGGGKVLKRRHAAGSVCAPGLETFRWKHMYTHADCKLELDRELSLPWGSWHCRDDRKLRMDDFSAGAN